MRSPSMGRDTPRSGAPDTGATRHAAVCALRWRRTTPNVAPRSKPQASDDRASSASCRRASIQAIEGDGLVRRAVARRSRPTSGRRVSRRGLTQQVVADAAGDLAVATSDGSERNEVATPGPRPPGVDRRGPRAPAPDRRLSGRRADSRPRPAPADRRVPDSRLHADPSPGGPRSPCRSPATDAPGTRSRSPTTAGPAIEAISRLGAVDATLRAPTRSSATTRGSPGSCCSSPTRRATGRALRLAHRHRPRRLPARHARGPRRPRDPGGARRSPGSS